MFKAGYVALVGRPNAGKSSLLNAIIGEKVAIVSSKPQTTRDNILGILTTEEYQLVFVDTPGVHHSKNLLDKAMMKNVRSALAGVDCVVYLVDGSKAPDEEELDYINHIEGDKIVVKTKTDLPKLQEFDCDIALSSKTGENVDLLISKILESIPEYEEQYYIYPPDYYTDKSVKFLISEEIREKALHLLNQEVPHGIAVEIIRFYEGENVVEIDADIVCEQERHKGMIIGKGGATLKEIGMAARKFATQLLDKKVMLKLFVKVEKDWRNKPQKVKNLGY
ncbi:MAG: GTPase Era [Clostridia bacterium]|nr:GTPase Era [Clostridia bacterium]